jgi:hypothetical protein
VIDFDEAIEQTTTRKGPQSHLSILLDYLDNNAPEQHAKVVAALHSRRPQTQVAEACTKLAQSIDGLLPRPDSAILGASVKAWRLANGIES